MWGCGGGLYMMAPSFVIPRDWHCFGFLLLFHALLAPAFAHDTRCKFPGINSSPLNYGGGEIVILLVAVTRDKMTRHYKYSWIRDLKKKVRRPSATIKILSPVIIIIGTRLRKTRSKQNLIGMDVCRVFMGADALLLQLAD